MRESALTRQSFTLAGLDRIVSRCEPQVGSTSAHASNFRPVRNLIYKFGDSKSKGKPRSSFYSDTHTRTEGFLGDLIIPTVVLFAHFRGLWDSQSPREPKEGLLRYASTGCRAAHRSEAAPREGAGSQITRLPPSFSFLLLLLLKERVKRVKKIVPSGFSANCNVLKNATLRIRAINFVYPPSVCRLKKKFRSCFFLHSSYRINTKRLVTRPQ